jgi:hypothetical protein
MFTFSGRFNAMRAHTGTYYIVVIENVKLQTIVACGSLIVEQKFIHETALVSIPALDKVTLNIDK